MERLYKYRFEIFLFSQVVTLFGSLLFPISLFNKVIFPILLLLNIGAGIILISKNKKVMWFFILLFSIAILTLGNSFLVTTEINNYFYARLGVNFLFYGIITIEIIKQIWNATLVNKNVIIGLMSGYICLGLMACFMFSFIEFTTPDSFQGLLISDQDVNTKMDSLLYYSFITLLTIGYGEIIPMTPAAQKAAILTGLVGQFYLVIITAVVVEKYIHHSKNTQNG